MRGSWKSWIGRKLTDYLDRPLRDYVPATPPNPDALRRTLRAGDVLLLEGNSRIGSAIKYLTQSTWSHAAMYVGPMHGREESGGEPHVLVEALLGEGVISSPLSKYQDAHLRVCRPLALTPEDLASVTRFMVAHLGAGYDVKNVLDLARFLVPMPIPARFRRKMIALGSGSPTRVICSTLIAQAFDQVRYPILPHVADRHDDSKVKSDWAREEILHIRHHSLYAPRDFDLSPYFAVVKPTIEKGFDYKEFDWRREVGPKLRPMRQSVEASSPF